MILEFSCVLSKIFSSSVLVWHILIKKTLWSQSVQTLAAVHMDTKFCLFISYMVN